jgi:hypothetical protein
VCPVIRLHRGVPGTRALKQNMNYGLYEAVSVGHNVAYGKKDCYDTAPAIESWWSLGKLNLHVRLLTIS